MRGIALAIIVSGLVVSNTIARKTAEDTSNFEFYAVLALSFAMLGCIVAGV